MTLALKFLSETPLVLTKLMVCSFKISSVIC
jgi:hypothetical protein